MLFDWVVFFLEASTLQATISPDNQGFLYIQEYLFAKSAYAGGCAIMYRGEDVLLPHSIFGGYWRLPFRNRHGHCLRSMSKSIPLGEVPFFLCLKHPCAYVTFVS